MGYTGTNKEEVLFMAETGKTVEVDDELEEIRKVYMYILYIAFEKCLI